MAEPIGVALRQQPGLPHVEVVASLLPRFNVIAEMKLICSVFPIINILQIGFWCNSLSAIKAKFLNWLLTGAQFSHHIRLNS
jgi:hypothetical protein